jgi:hypothetical protein
MGAYISKTGKDACISSLRHWTMSFANFIRENSSGIHQVEGQLEMAKD